MQSLLKYFNWNNVGLIVESPTVDPMNYIQASIVDQLAEANISLTQTQFTGRNTKNIDNALLAMAKNSRSNVIFVNVLLYKNYKLKTQMKCYFFFILF